MKRSLLLLALAVFALGFAAVHDAAQDSASAPPTTTGNFPGLIQMNRIAVIPSPASQIISAPQGFDLDHDGKREFIVKPANSGPDDNSPLEFYESVADDTFVLVHVLDLENDPVDVYVPTDAGDIDDDGLADLVVRGKNWFESGPTDYLTRVYESESTDTYPTKLVWEVVVPVNAWYLGGLIADADTDGKQEIVVLDRAADVAEIVVYENDGDDSYVQTYSSGTIPGEFSTGAIYGDCERSRWRR